MQIPRLSLTGNALITTLFEWHIALLKRLSNGNFHISLSSFLTVKYVKFRWYFFFFFGFLGF